jgi:hypothetical protein
VAQVEDWRGLTRKAAVAAEERQQLVKPYKPLTAVMEAQEPPHRLLEHPLLVAVAVVVASSEWLRPLVQVELAAEVTAPTPARLRLELSIPAEVVVAEEITIPLRLVAMVGQA